MFFFIVLHLFYEEDFFFHLSWISRLRSHFGSFHTQDKNWILYISCTFVSYLKEIFFTCKCRWAASFDHIRKNNGIQANLLIFVIIFVLFSRIFKYTSHLCLNFLFFVKYILCSYEEINTHLMKIATSAKITKRL